MERVKRKRGQREERRDDILVVYSGRGRSRGLLQLGIRVLIRLVERRD